MGQTAEQARFNMIQQQIRPWDVVDDRVLDVMADIDREAFVPNAYLGLAYADIEIPIGDDQAMMAPRIVARMLQALNPQPKDTALELGTGTGYATACLSRLSSHVVSLECSTELFSQAQDNLQAYKNVELREADGLGSAAEGGPFDVIAVTGSLPTEDALPELRNQLRPGGRLFVVLGQAPAMEALLITRTGDHEFRRESLFETELAALDNAPEAEQFSF